MVWFFVVWFLGQANDGVEGYDALYLWWLQKEELEKNKRIGKGSRLALQEEKKNENGLQLWKKEKEEKPRKRIEEIGWGFLQNERCMIVRTKDESLKKKRMEKKGKKRLQVPHRSG